MALGMRLELFGLPPTVWGTRDKVLSPVYSPISTISGGHSRPQSRLFLLAAGGWARGPSGSWNTG